MVAGRRLRRRHRPSGGTYPVLDSQAGFEKSTLIPSGLIKRCCLSYCAILNKVLISNLSRSGSPMKSSSVQNAREAEGWGAFSSLSENRKSGVGNRGGGSHVHCVVAFFFFRKELSDCRNERFSPGSRNKTRHAQNLRFSQCLCTASQKACSSQWFLHSFETVDALQNLQNSKARHLGKYTVGSFQKKIQACDGR